MENDNSQLKTGCEEGELMTSSDITDNGNVKTRFIVTVIFKKALTKRHVLTAAVRELFISSPETLLLLLFVGKVCNKGCE